MSRFARSARALPFVGSAWADARRRQFLREYRRRRDSYAAAARARGLVYDPARSFTEARTRIAARGRAIAQRAAGDVHTLAFVPRISWHEVLIDELRALGPLTLFDYTELGISWLDLYNGDRDARRRLGEAFQAHALEADRRRSVDWVFVYASGVELTADALRSVQGSVAAPVVGMCFDDKNSWVGPGKDAAGQRDLAADLDVAWTSARVATDWYLVEGGRPVYLPEGCSPALFKPADVVPDLDVTFVGEAYGFRPKFVSRLQRAGVRVEAFGRGWRNGPVSFTDYIALLSRSRVNLGIGGIGYAPDITNVKGRDFEIPCAGGGVYLTTFNCDLAQHFDVGREILCYRDVDEAVELCRYYLAHPEEARQIAARARARCLREHTWRARFLSLLDGLGVTQCAA